MANPTMNERRARVNSAPVLISVASAAELLDVSQKSIRRRIAEDKLTGYRVGPRSLRVNLDEVLALARPLGAA